MLRSIKPSKLRGYNDRRIEDSIINLMEYDCAVARPVITIGPINDYESPNYLLKDADRLRLVGDVRVYGTRAGVFVEVTLNEIALEVIENRDKKEEKE